MIQEVDRLLVAYGKRAVAGGATPIAGDLCSLTITHARADCWRIVWGRTRADEGRLVLQTRRVSGRSLSEAARRATRRMTDDRGNP